MYVNLGRLLYFCFDFIFINSEEWRYVGLYDCRKNLMYVKCLYILGCIFEFGYVKGSIFFVYGVVVVFVWKVFYFYYVLWVLKN